MNLIKNKNQDIIEVNIHLKEDNYSKTRINFIQLKVIHSIIENKIKSYQKIKHIKNKQEVSKLNFKIIQK